MLTATEEKAFRKVYRQGVADARMLDKERNAAAVSTEVAKVVGTLQAELGDQREALTRTQAAVERMEATVNPPHPITLFYDAVTASAEVAGQVSLLQVLINGISKGFEEMKADMASEPDELKRYGYRVALTANEGYLKLLLKHAAQLTPICKSRAESARDSVQLLILHFQEGNDR